MTPCRDWKHSVSTSAKACPGCGALSPGTGKFAYFLGRRTYYCFWGAVLVILLQIAFAFAADTKLLILGSEVQIDPLTG